MSTRQIVPGIVRSVDCLFETQWNEGHSPDLSLAAGHKILSHTGVSPLRLNPNDL